MNRTWLNPVAYDRYSFIKVEVDDNGVGTVTMNEPDKLNAIGPEQHREIEDIWLDLARDESIRTIVFTGAGRAFSAGGDVKRMAQRAGNQFGLEYALRVPQNTLRVFEHQIRRASCRERVGQAV